jgi:hypothetical protein
MDFLDSFTSAETAFDIIWMSIGHLFLLFTFFMLFWWLIKELREPSDNHAAFGLRVFALVLGGLIAWGTKLAGLSYPDLIIASLSSTSMVYQIFGWVISPIAGVVVGFIFTRLHRRGGEIARRVCILFATIALLFFLFTYGYFVENQDFYNADLIIPNLFFIIGIFLIIVFFSDRSKKKDVDERQEKPPFNPNYKI